MNSKPTNQPPEGREETPDCSTHRKDLNGLTDMKAVAESIGNLHYETLAELLLRLKEKLQDDSTKDKEGGRELLAKKLWLAAGGIYTGYVNITIASAVCKQFMNEARTPPATVIQPLGLQDAAFELAQAVKILIGDIKSKPNDTRYLTSMKVGAKALLKYDELRLSPTPPPQPEDALAGKYADKMIDLGWRDNTDKDVIISDFKSGYSAKPDLINLKKIVENAHMAGQRNAGIDPSYHAALHYYNSEIKDVAPQSSTSEEEKELWKEVSNLFYEFRMESRFDMDQLLSTYKISKR